MKNYKDKDKNMKKENISHVKAVKTIGIDGNEANLINRVGVNQYAFNILWGLYRLEDRYKKGYKFIVYLKNRPLKDLPPEDSWWTYKVLGGRKVWILIKLMPYLFKNRKEIDVLFSPSHYTVPFSPISRVCSIMDLGYLKFSGQFKKLTYWQLKAWTAISIFVSKYIIAISKATKKDIVRHYPFASKKVIVTYLAYDKDKYNTKVSINDVRRIKKRYAIVDDYILFLSTLKPSKNIEGILDAFSKIKEGGNKIKLVIAGKKGWMFESIFEEVKKLGLEEDVIFTGYIKKEEKTPLISGAKMFISPSFWEGFGMHVLEAMACGVPVVVSDVGSFPEIVGESGIIVDPYDSSSIANGILKVLNLDEKGYNSLIDKGTKQAEKFSWDKTAQETFDVLIKAIN